MKKIIRYNKSVTNREYLETLKNYDDFNILNEIILPAEICVFFKDNINETECREIQKKIINIISK